MCQEPHIIEVHTWRALMVPDWSLGGWGHPWHHGLSWYVFYNWSNIKQIWTSLLMGYTLYFIYFDDKTMQQNFVAEEGHTASLHLWQLSRDGQDRRQDGRCEDRPGRRPSQHHCLVFAVSTLHFGISAFWNFGILTFWHFDILTFRHFDISAF